MVTVSPRVSDRSISYPQVNPLRIDEGLARVHYDEENHSIGGDTESRTLVSGVTDRRNDHYTISPEKDATYTESPTANYRMNTMDANPHSMARRKEIN